MVEKNELIHIITSFLKEIGIEVVYQNLEDSCFLPGLTIYKNSIIIDKEKLLYPGDLLHEAGHIAVTEPQQRDLIGTSEIDSNWPDEGNEITSILWSYAALYHLNISPEVVFHENGYKKQSQ